MMEVLIRRPLPEEHNSVRALVQTVVEEVYGGIWVPSPLPIDEERWHLSWIAVLDTKIVGVVLTGDEWLDDLWVLRENRGYGVGHSLIETGEAEIIARGHKVLSQARLEDRSGVPTRKIPGNDGGNVQICSARREVTALAASFRS